MDLQRKTGLGVSVVVFLLPYAIPSLPEYISWAGIFSALLFILLSLPAITAKIPTRLGFLIILVSFFSIIGIGWSFKSSTLADKPDVTIRLVYAKSPTLLIGNSSDIIARDIKYWSAIWNLDSPAQPLPIPVDKFDYIKPHEASGPRAFFSLPNVERLLKQGNRLAGFIGITCAECVTTRYFWVYVTWGTGGWSSELAQNTVIDLQALGKLIPSIANDPEEFFKDIPQESRIPIM